MKKLIIALSVAASISAQADDFVITTGSDGGFYQRVGNTFSQKIDSLSKGKRLFDISVIESTGSVENIRRINDGEAQAAIVQSDVMSVMPASVPVRAKTAHTETVFWLYSSKHGISDLEGIEGDKNTLMVLVDGSGAMVTMQSFAKEDSGYQVNYDNAIIADSLYDAADIVSEGSYNGKKVAGLLYVGRHVPAEIGQDFKGAINVGQATDSDFNDAEDVNGDPLYTNCAVNETKTAGLGAANSFFDNETVCLKAMIVYVQDLDRRSSKVIKRAANKTARAFK